MNIGVFAYGRAGCKIADQINRFDSRSKHSICAFTMAADTASEQLLELDHIDKDWLIVYGKDYFGGTGSKGDIRQSSAAVPETKQYIGQAVNTVPRKNLDAFVVIGSFGGGTGAVGPAHCAHILKENVPEIPTYGVGTLPSRHEPDVYKINAARSIQTLSRETNSTFVFDNNHLRACLPIHHPRIEDSLPHSAMFSRVNQGIARCIHKLFSADELSPPERLTDVTPQKRTVIETLSAGGLSTFCYAAESSPQSGFSTLVDRLWGTSVRVSKVLSDRVFSRQSDTGDDSDGPRFNQGPDGTSSRSDNRSTFAFSDPERGSIRTHPSSSQIDFDLPSIKADTGNAVILSDGTHIDVESLPEVIQSETLSQSSDGDRPPRQPAASHDYTNPVRLAPLVLDKNSAMVPFPPTETSSSLHLLIAPESHLTQSHVHATQEWANATTNAFTTTSKAYPTDSDGVGVLSLNVGIGVPTRVQQLQQYADRAVKTSPQTGSMHAGERGYDAFEDVETTVPPVF